MIKLATLVRENLEALEVIEFYKRATPEEQIDFERLMNAGKEKQLKALIFRVTQSNQVGFPEYHPGDLRASRLGAS